VNMRGSTSCAIAKHSIKYAIMKQCATTFVLYVVQTHLEIQHDPKNQ
jgi:hypothetical protein